MRKITETLLVSMVFALGCSFSAKAGINDYRVLSDVYGFYLQGSIKGVEVTPDDRFVVVLAERQLGFLDTWTFEMVPGSTAIVDVDSGTTATALAISPDGNHAYVGFLNGEVDAYDISSLYSLGPGETLLTALSKQDSPNAATGAIEDIEAVSDSGGTETVWIFLSVPSASLIYWLSHDSAGFDSMRGWSLTKHTLDFSSSGNWLYELYERNTDHFFQINTCADGAGCGILTPVDARKTLSFSDVFADIAADPVEGTYAVVTNVTSDELWIHHSSSPTAVNGLRLGDTLSAFIGEDLAILARPLGIGDLAVTAGASSVALSEISAADVLFSGSYLELTHSGETVEVVTASGGTDGYVYLGGRTTVRPLSANPWITSVTANGGTTVTELTGDTFAIDLVFECDSSGNFTAALFDSPGFGEWTNRLVSLPGSTAKSRRMVANTSLLSECDNYLTATVTDSTEREGRKAINVFADFPPPPPSFQLGFGDRSIKVSFTAQDLCDLDRYIIYYGTDPSVGDSVSQLSGSSAYSSVTVSSPLPGDDIERRITGLTNGVTYYFYLVVYDDGGDYAISARKQETPQPVLGLAGRTGDEGGVDCLGSVGETREGDGRSLFIVLFPLFAVLAFRLYSRWSK